MNEHRNVEHEIRETLNEHAPFKAPDHLLHVFEYDARRTRRYPRWLALIKEPPMRISSNVAVGSPTARVAAIIVATVLIALSVAAAGLAGSRLLAAEPIIVVDQGASDGYRSIAAAVADAEDGATILVKPGRYAEAIAVIGKTLTIRGDGDRAHIVVEATPADYPSDIELEPGSDEGIDRWAFVLAETDTTLSNLTIVGNDSGNTIVISGAIAAPTIEDVEVRQLGHLYNNASIWWRLGAAGRLTDSVVEGYMAIEGSPELAGNEMSQVCIDVWPDEPIETRPSIHGNSMSACPAGYAIWVEDASAVIAGNDLTARGFDITSEGQGTALIIGGNVADIEVRENEVHDSRIGISVESGSTGSLAENRLSDNEIGIELTTGEVELRANTIDGGEMGVSIVGGSPTLLDNTVTGAAGPGVVLSGGTTATLSGNTLCDNGEDLFVAEDAEPALTGNEICGEVATGG